MPTKVGIHSGAKKKYLDSHRVESSTRFRGNDKLSQHLICGSGTFWNLGTDFHPFLPFCDGRNGRKTGPGENVPLPDLWMYGNFNIFVPA
jgi:hypothetical protein